MLTKNTLCRRQGINIIKQYSVLHCSNKSSLSAAMFTRKLCYREDDCAMIYEPLRRYGHSKLSKMAAAAILDLFESKIVQVDLPYPKTPPPEPNIKWIGRAVAKIWPFEIFPTWRWQPFWICSNRK